MIGGSADAGARGPTVPHAAVPGIPGAAQDLGPYPRLARDFFARDSVVVARDLIGREIVTGIGGQRVVVRLSEVEAYAGGADPASHAYRGETARTAVMFGPAGFLYVYFVYGMHWCANVVTGRAGAASAVLLRAGAVVDGVEVAAQRRPRAGCDTLARGPAAVTAVLGITGSATGLDLCAPDASLYLRTGTPAPEGAVRTGPRVGVSAAAELPWRFFRAGDPTVSRYRAGARRRPTGRGSGPTPGSGSPIPATGQQGRPAPGISAGSAGPAMSD